MPAEPILIVDDNPVNQKLLRVLLVGEGYTVKTASTAQEVAVILESFRPRLILMDIQLPGISGLELTQKLRADPRMRRETIIIAITAYAMKGDDEKAFQAGCDGYIAKPIDTRTLPGILAQYLAKR